MQINTRNAVRADRIQVGTVVASGETVIATYRSTNPKKIAVELQKQGRSENRIAHWNKSTTVFCKELPQ